jgi:amino acid transporter
MLRIPEIMRTFGAFVAAVLAIGIGAAILVLPFEPRGAWLAGKLAAEVAAVVALALGIPAHVILRLINKTSWRNYLAAGGVLSGVVTFLLVWLGFNEFPGAISIAGITLLFGIVGSLTFWLVARPDRPSPRR